MRVHDLPPLRLGPDVVQLLLPHRRPFLMIDRIEGFSDGAVPSLVATRMISANEPVFQGHFPGVAIWPGVYTIEGLGQACNALLVILALRETFVARGASGDDLLASLRNLELRFRLSPAHRDDQSSHLLEALATSRSWPIGMNAAVSVKFVRPVFGGECLTYFVQRTRVHEDLTRCDVEASVDGQVVASGTMTNARGPAVSEVRGRNA